MQFKKTINIFHADEGLRIVNINQWSGKALACYRNSLDALLNRKESKKRAVYFLIGRLDGIITIYVGQTDNFYKRIQKKDHKERDFWNEIIMFIGEDLTPGGIKYLEANFLKDLKTANQVKIENIEFPYPPALPEDLEESLKEYKFNSSLILETLGYPDIMQEIPLTVQSSLSKPSSKDLTFLV